MDEAFDWQAFVESACRWKGLMKPEAAPWMAPIVEAGEAKGLAARDIERAVMRDDRFPGALTDEGATDPDRAAELTIHAALMAFYRERDRRRHALFPGHKVKVVAVSDRRKCRLVTPLIGKKFSQAEAPRFPLPGCDAEMCRCSLQLQLR